jgi:uncharacterized protein YndB with AHSA1/START domain
MSASDSAGAVRKTVVVRCDVDAAFRTWTERIDAWWPKSHSRSGDPCTLVFLEGRLGGRIYERTPEGIEHDWGEVIAWEPPAHLAYYWYLGSGADRPSRVDVRFVSDEQGGAPEWGPRTRVEVSHEGPELLGELWARTSPRFSAGWGAVLPSYAAACEMTE